MGLPDVRMRGFQHRADAAAVTRLVDGRVRPLAGEVIPVARGCGRILSGDVFEAAGLPFPDVAEREGADVGVHPRAEGGRLLPRGRRLCPLDLALLTQAGIREVDVFSRPRVEVLVTGNELLPCGARPEGYK